MSLLVQYLGFESKADSREYKFAVKDSAETPREFRLTIENEAFVSHRVRYQDAPSICSLRLHTELAAFANHPVETFYRITGAELDSYRESHSPKPIRGMYKPRPRDDSE
ncbi:MAG TPA: hypothetical protein VJR26_14270 [Candidatus Acidoferrales bacterium]|nr:hypothetical protein [Candidatus Acidoferrales bacterium]